MLLSSKILYLLFSTCLLRASQLFGNDNIAYVSSSGNNTAPCGSSQNAACNSVSLALSANPSSTTINLLSDSIEDTYVQIQGMIQVRFRSFLVTFCSI